MKRLIICFVSLIVAMSASFDALAYAYPSASVGAFGSAGGLHSWLGITGTPTGGGIVVADQVSVGGVRAVVTATARVLPMAGTVAIGVVRMIPGVAGAATILWLATKGIEYVEGRWVKHGDSVPANSDPLGGGFTWVCNGNVTGALGDELAQSCASASGWGTISNLEYVANGSAAFNVVADTTAFSGRWTVAVLSKRTTCLNGYHIEGSLCIADNICPTAYSYRDGVCWPDALEEPTESDWAKFRNEVPPDDVLAELCHKIAAQGATSAGCPVAQPKLEPKVVPLSDWQQDPQTGDWTRQVAKITPAPTAADAERVQVETVTETKPGTAPIDPATGQPSDTATGTETKNQNEDFCVMHPDAMACAALGDPPEVPELLTKQQTLTISPDSGWGPDGGACPADLSYTTRGGLVVRFSYEQVCTAATTFRPVVIGLAWISAVLIFLGVSRRANG